MRVLLGIAAAMLAWPALAQTSAIDAARAAGAVGERYDGYIGIAAPVSAQVRSQIGTINIKRRSLYSNLAATRGASPQEVGITAGCQLLARVRAGDAYMLSDGIWRRRLAGQKIAPDYCG